MSARLLCSPSSTKPQGLGFFDALDSPEQMTEEDAEEALPVDSRVEYMHGRCIQTDFTNMDAVSRKYDPREFAAVLDRVRRGESTKAADHHKSEQQLAEIVKAYCPWVQVPATGSSVRGLARCE